MWRLASEMTGVTFFAFWSGPDLSCYEELCLKSVLKSGFKIDVFTYEKRLSVPQGVLVKDAREVISETEFNQIVGIHGIAAFSDLFRYAGIQMGLGVWTDTDMLFLNNGFSSSSYIFAWEKQNELVNGAILGMPSDSELIIELSDQARSILQSPKKIKWGAVGPRLLQDLIYKFDLVNLVAPQDDFYKLHYSDIWRVFDPTQGEVLSLDLENVTAVHLWNNVISSSSPLKYVPPPVDSWLQKQFKTHDVVFLENTGFTGWRQEIVSEKFLRVIPNGAIAERDGAIAERDGAIAERDGVLNSRTWRFFRIYRKIKAFLA